MHGPRIEVRSGPIRLGGLREEPHTVFVAPRGAKPTYDRPCIPRILRSQEQEAAVPEVEPHDPPLGDRASQIGDEEGLLDEILTDPQPGPVLPPLDPPGVHAVHEIVRAVVSSGGGQQPARAARLGNRREQNDQTDHDGRERAGPQGRSVPRFPGQPGRDRNGQAFAEHDDAHRGEKQRLPYATDQREPGASPSCFDVVLCTHRSGVQKVPFRPRTLGGG